MTHQSNVIKLKILIGVSLAGGLGILPFAIYRYSIQDWLIGTMDLIAGVGMLILAVYVYRAKQIIIATHVMLSITLIILTFTIYNKGAQQAYWIYPALISFYYLHKPKTAILYTCITAALLLPVLYQQMTTPGFFTLITTILMTLLLAYIFASEVESQQKLLLEQATKDPLTGAGNRRALAVTLDQQVASFRRNGNKTTVLLLDMDHFKKINDKYGHNAGDRFLIHLTKTLNSRIRITDSLFRFGGEEFIVVAKNIDLEAGRILAEELRSTIEKGNLIPETNTTVSIGVAELQADETSDNLIKRADDALFQAKELGRNRVIVSPPD